MSRLEEKTLHTEKIFTGKVISLQVEDVELPNGNVSKREIIKHPGAVAILALTDDDKIVMVEQYRKALEKTIIEIPAGKLEHGEDPGTHFGETKEVSSISVKPALFNPLIKSFLISVGTKAFSFCSPSRGPTSIIVTLAGNCRVMFSSPVS